MRTETRGVFALVAAAMLSMLPLLAGQGSPWILLLIPIVVLVAIAAIGGPIALPIAPRRMLDWATYGSLGLGVAVSGRWLFDALNPSSPGAVASWAACLALVALCAVQMSRKDAAGLWSVAFFVTYTLIALWVLSETGGSFGFLDFVLFQQEAASVLLDGGNPYTAVYHDLYGSWSSTYYGPGVSVDGVLQFGFPYPPLSLLLVAPFEWLFSDFRIAHTLALVSAAALMSRLGGGRASRAAAASFLLISPSLLVLAIGWTEPLLVVGLIAVLYAHGRSSRSTPYVLGLAMAVKQYAIILLPSSMLLYKRPLSLRSVASDLAKTVAVIALVTVPFVLWNPSAFYRSVIELQFLQPFRYDAISIPALWATHFGQPSTLISTLLPIAGIVVVTGVTWKRTPTGGQGFALASALTLLVIFVSSKQAFVNYYLVVIALLFAACSLADSTERSDETVVAVGETLPVG